MAKTEQPQLLTREIGLETLTTPTGRTLAAVKYETNPALLRVAYADGKGGTLPDELQGLYTKRTLAEDAIKSWLGKFWDTSDKAKSKAA